jgi:5-(carboxyamino)imidazole ribonucleotide synthase
VSAAAAVLQPGARIGILGGGQLGRMLALAAARLGFDCHIYAPDPQSCAFAVAHTATCAEYADQAALARFAEDVDVISYEFENVPAETAAFLAARRSVIPDPAVLALTQDRLIEKEFISRLAIDTAPFAPVGSLEDLRDAVSRLRLPAVLKTRRLGYDGKGQKMIGPGDDPAAAWAALGQVPAILEGFVAFEREVSVVAARGREARIECFDVTENEHRDHILKLSRVPAEVTPAVAGQARRVTEAIASALDHVGALAVEMFVVRQGTSHAVLVNEIAPRVHNSGHWTIDGATVSQFEQHIRAIAGWPLAKPIRHGPVEMINLIGPEVDDYANWLETPGTAVHLYGKVGAHAGRKMGHLTRLLGKKP